MDDDGTAEFGSGISVQNMDEQKEWIDKRVDGRSGQTIERMNE